MDRNESLENQIWTFAGEISPQEEPAPNLYLGVLLVVGEGYGCALLVLYWNRCQKKEQKPLAGLFARDAAPTELVRAKTGFRGVAKVLPQGGTSQA